MVTKTSNLNPLAREFAALQFEVQSPAEPTSFEGKQEGPPPSQASTTAKVTGKAKRMFIITDAHQDDIHGMIPAAPGTFVTGSKDGSLKLWSCRGEWLRNVWVPKTSSYTGWITALAPFGRNHWMSGTRDGYIDLWENDGMHTQTLAAPQRSATGFKCKARNTDRINCITQDLTAEKTAQYYVGIATQFSLHNTSGQDSLSRCSTSENDWVYCIRPLADRKVLVVTGPNLDIYTEHPKTKRWVAEELIAEPRKKPGENKVRPFISDVTFLDGKVSTCALSVFGGPVVLFDVEAKTPVRTYVEHEKRVWQIANIRPEVFASCSDDKTIKIWDARMAQSVLTIGDHVGRVSCLLRLSPTQLVSGSCPDDLEAAEERARLEFWDIRSL